MTDKIKFTIPALLWNSPSVIRIREKLDQWAQMSPDQIAQEIASKGWKGLRAHGCQCPVTVTLRREALTDCTIYVGGQSTIFYTEGGVGIEIPIPESVRRFIAAFDQGYYPSCDLEVRKPLGELDV